MPTGRADRRRERTQRAQAEFGAAGDAALDLLEITELAWHDCHGDASPPEPVIDDIFVAAQGSLTDFVRAARLAVEDFRDLRVWASSVRG